MKHISSFASIILAVSAFFVCSCNLVEQPAAVDGGKVNFKASVGEFTKVSESGFSNGDEIAISAGAPINSAFVPYTFEAGRWNSSNEIRWADGQTGATRFFAYYPYKKAFESNGIIDVSVINDQDQIHNSDFDFMTASVEAAPGDGSVNLVFNHRMSLVEVVINSTLPDSVLFIKSVTMDDLRTEASYSLEKDLVSVSGEAGTIAFYADRYQLEAGSTAVFHALIPPQSARPELGVLIGGRSYYFHLPSDFKFEEGKKYTAEITLEPGRLDADFVFSVNPWYNDDDLVFPEQDSWKYVGMGKYIDAVLAEVYAAANYEMDVEVYEDPSCPGRYKFANPYAGWPLWNTVNHDEGEIIINILPDGQHAYVEESHIGIEDYSLLSLVPENGWSDYSYYHYEYVPGVWSGSGILGFKMGDGVYGLDNNCMTTFTLPGNIRYPVYYDIESLFESGNGHFTYKVGMDLTEKGFAIIPTPCQITDELLQSIISGNCDYQRMHAASNYGSETYNCGTDFNESCGIYAVVAGKCKYADGKEYWGYRTLRTCYRAEGQEDPECRIEVNDLKLSDNDPTAFEFLLKIRNVRSARYLALTAAEFEAFPDSTDWKSYVLENGQFISGTAYDFDTDGQKAVVDGLQYDTDYRILIAAENLFGKSGVVLCSGKTGSAMEFKSLGVGKFYDQLFPLYLSRSYSEMPDYLYNEVEILQEASGKPIYRVMNPYGKFWNLYANTEPYYNGGQCEYIEFYTREFPEGNFVFFKDFATGCDFYEDFDGDGTPEPYGLYCNHYVRGYADNPAAGAGTSQNRQLTDGVFQIAPALFIGDSGYYYAYYDYSEAIIICLPGYDYTFSFELPQTNSAGHASTRLKPLEKVKVQ